ncbi:MAG: glycoside hydrolase family 32 protein, partial [Nocardioides sp.]
MRPRIHLTAPSGWLNDPHGITARNGGYDVFHQAIPDSLAHHPPRCSWAHATSPDLLRFEHRPVALAPDADEDGIWTGSIAVADDGARLFYTAVDLPDAAIGRIRVATPTDGTWDTWTKGEVVVTVPDHLDLIAFRDPFVLREHDRWRMVVGAGAADGTALAPTWVSDDLVTWAYDGVALSRSTHEHEPEWMGSIWECPQVLEVADRWAMVGSVWDHDVLHHAGYALGDFAGGRFDATGWGRLTWGTYYAPTYFPDAEGRPCVMLWMRDVGDHDEGWQSCLSVPHLLDVRDERLTLMPHPHLLDALADPVDLRGDLPDAAVSATRCSRQRTSTRSRCSWTAPRWWSGSLAGPPGGRCRRPPRWSPTATSPAAWSPPRVARVTALDPAW